MKETELKPCPFCGGEAELMKHTECAGHGCYIPQVFVACKQCRAKGGLADGYFDNGDLESIAVERWNRRAYERKRDLYYFEEGKLPVLIETSENKQREGEWISVEDDTPKNSLARVQVFLRDADITDGIGFPKIDTDRYIDGKWVRWGKYVTHWKPLPDAPKGEDDG